MSQDGADGSVEAFLSEVLGSGTVPPLPSFLGEEWEPVADAVASLLDSFEDIMVIEIALPGGAEVYAQFARRGGDIVAEVVSNEFLDSSQFLPADRVSVLLELGWEPPGDSDTPNFSKSFVEPDYRQLAWTVLQTLHDVYNVRPDDVWSVSPAELGDGEARYAEPAGSIDALDPSEITVLEEAPLVASADGGPDLNRAFQMPKAVTIMGRSSSVTNSFANSIIPVVMPTLAQVREALDLLDMRDGPVCAYCGDAYTEWDHLRPIIVNKAPTGYISEIHNLVPACGKCNQSKGNRHWRIWMFSSAKKSPKNRGIPDLDTRAERLTAYESWKPPTQLDFVSIVGTKDWDAYWQTRVALFELMKKATSQAGRIRLRVAAAHAGTPVESPSIGTEPTPSPASVTEGSGGWLVSGPKGVVGPVPKSRAVLEAVHACVAAGMNPADIASLVGKSHLRAVAGTLTGPDLWNQFAMTHARAEHHRRLWYLDSPIHATDTTWVLANNVWGQHAEEVLRALSQAPRGAVRVTQPNGAHLRIPDTGEGLIVLKPGEAPPPQRPRGAHRHPQSPTPDHADPSANPVVQAGLHAEWNDDDRLIIARLSAADSSWRDVIDAPPPGLGPRGLRIADDLLALGARVRPVREDEFGDLRIELGGRRLLAVVNDYGVATDSFWARLIETLGPYHESVTLDRTLADFSVHGPFERNVIRSDGRVQVEVLVRLTDVASALFDLDNVSMALRTALAKSAIH